MPKFLFTERSVLKGTVPVVYEAGSVHDLRTDQINRWISRGAGTADPIEIAKALGIVEPPAAPQEPRMIEVVGGFDVLNSAGAKVNDRPLKRKLAEEALAGLIAAAPPELEATAGAEASI